jgi:hypothetical protein
LNPYAYENTHHVIYHKTCAEFERARSICLEEDNWLRSNYTQENLVIEDHSGYVVVYQNETNKPIIMAGAYNNGKFPTNVARIANRLYLFPEFRCGRHNMVESYKIHHERIVKPLMEINDFNLYVITMQNRIRGSKSWWSRWKKMMQESSNNMWVEPNGYLQTCPWMVQKCWQNFVYTELTSGAFNSWSPKLLTDEQWASLPEGT